MDTEERKIKTQFISDLTDLFCRDSADDKDFLKRLVWANIYITKEINKYLEDYAQEI